MRISDWSSDVCSSDLLPQQVPVQACNRHEAPRGQPGDFDFYLFSFSWSPAFCATAAGRRSALQCRDNHFGWVLHGLWPQYAASRGITPPWPQYCGPVAPVPEAVLRRHLCATPDPRLLQCEWRSEEHTSELQSLMRISYAVFCLKKKK